MQELSQQRYFHFRMHFHQMNEWRCRQSCFTCNIAMVFQVFKLVISPQSLKHTTSETVCSFFFKPWTGKNLNSYAKIEFLHEKHKNKNVPLRIMPNNRIQSELPWPIPWNSLESGLWCTSRIYFDNVTVTLHNLTLASQKPCRHNYKFDCSKTNGHMWSN